MDEGLLERLNDCRESLRRDPEDRDALLNFGSLMAEIDQPADGAEILNQYLQTHAGDREISTLASELGHKGWLAVAAGNPGFTQPPPANFIEISTKVDTVLGWILKEQEIYLFDKVRSLPDGAVILEMGCCRGKSTVAMAFACLGTRKHIYSIDSFSGNDGQMGAAVDFESEWRDNLRRFGLESYATPLRGYTCDVIPDRSLYPSPDLVFIDASHEFTDVIEDFRGIYPYVKDGGWIAFHDVEAGWPGPWRVWKDYATHILEHHEYSSTLACGRKAAGRPFKRRDEAAPTFSFSSGLRNDFRACLGSTHDLVRAMDASLAGKDGTREERVALLEAEKRLMEAPVPEFHAVLQDMMLARDGRIDGLLRLWTGLSHLGQGRLQEALDLFDLVPRVSLPLSAYRILPYVEEIRARNAGLRPTPPDGGPANPATVAALLPHLRENDTVIALGGGDGSLLASLACACKVAVESDRELRRKSITEFGVDSIETWDDLTDGCADAIVSENGLARDPAPLQSLRSARSKLRAGGLAVYLSGREATEDDAEEANPSFYSWNAYTLANLFEAAGFRIRSVEALGPGSRRIKLVAEKP